MAKITLIGAGNVGHHLGHQLYKEGHQIIQVYSRTHKNALKLASAIEAQPISDLEQIIDEADFYLLAVSDDAIASLANRLSGKIGLDKIVAHTSGATPSTVLMGLFAKYGIFYPLQTFSKDHPADFTNIPFCIDASDAGTLRALIHLAQSIATSVYPINDEQRSILHVAAVFVNNFTNQMLAIGEHITEQENLPFNLLKPLIFETVNKIATNRAEDMQTGPAIRGDEQTINRHLEYLDKFPAYKEVYKLISKVITELK